MSTSSSKTHTGVALVGPGKLNLIELPTRTPKDHEVLVKVAMASYGAADGHAVDDGYYVNGYPDLLGLVCAGTVVEVGKDVELIKKGDIVAAYTMPGADRATQEYVIAPAWRVSKIPDGIKPEHATAVLDNFATAWWTLTNSLKLPLPTKIPSTDLLGPVETDAPILVWGGGTASAKYMIQVLRMLGFTNIIATASERSAPQVFALGATEVLHYNDPDVAAKVKVAAGSSPIKHAVDTVCTERSMREIAKVVQEPGSVVALLVPFKLGNLPESGYINAGGARFLHELPREHNPFEIGVDTVPTYGFNWEDDTMLKANLLTQIFPELLRSNHIKSQPVRLIKEGTFLERVLTAASLVKNNELYGEKAIILLDS